MLGLQFSVRTSAGDIDSGSLSLGGDSETIRMAGISDISLNTSAAAISGYTREGGDLVITLVGGKTIRLEGFFLGEEKELLLSEHGQMTHVEFYTEAEGDLAATYANVDLSGKWSEYDQLAFLDLERIEPVVAPIAAGFNPLLGLIGGGGAAAAAVIGGGLGGGGGGGDTAAPDITITDGTESTGDLLNGEDYDSGSFDISGESEAGATVDVTIGDTTQSTVVDENGNWSVTFPSETVTEGEYETDVTVVVTDGAGNSSSVTDKLVVDTEAELLTFDTVAGDDIVNIDEASGAVSVSGTSEAGATVVITMEGQTATTTVAEDGTWSVTFDGTQFPAGTYDSTISATVTDAAGNAASYSHVVHVDLEAGLTVDAGSAGGDGMVNAGEMTGGVVLNGTGEAGSTVVVTVEGVERTTTVAGDGSWSVTYEPGSLPEGTYTAQVTAVSMDAAGNSATTSGTFEVDTEMSLAINGGHSGGDEVINADERGGDLTFSGTSQPNATVVVTIEGVEMTTSANESGVWSVTLPAGSVPEGEYDTILSAVATDAAGNTATTSSTVRVDTVAGDVALSSNPVEGDDVINYVEASDGVWITGTATPGLDVVVTLGGASHTVRATSGGTFAAKFAASEVIEGEYATEATATITDDAGNTKTVTRAVDVDTFVHNFNIMSSYGGTDDLVNHAEAQAGVTLSGVVEANSELVITVGGTNHNVSADGAGNWSLTLPAITFPAGEGDIPLTIKATDPAGNVDLLTDTIAYDTIVTALGMSGGVGGGDATFNAAEMAAGVTLTGTVEPGSEVWVTTHGVREQAAVDDFGNWTVTYADGALPEGDYTADVVIEAKDGAGNTRTETTSVEIDTVASAPVIEAVTRDPGGVRAVNIETTDDDVSVFAVAEDGGVSEMSTIDFDLPPTAETGAETMKIFTPGVPNGSQIVLTSEDDAGNSSDTLFVLDTTTERPAGEMFEVDLDNAGLDGFDFGAIDLQYVNGGAVTLSAADIDRIAGVDKTITIHGGTDDQVTFEGATATERIEDVDGVDYAVYTLGTGAEVWVNEDISVVLT
ncbi:Ig-like domain-containing protein [Celeribacter sp.]|uniref:Ig-like domain-containing protein n=1 Tax=Celeribacter sp. TaxID=1890673 RepID=UPI003A93FEAB